MIENLKQQLIFMFSHLWSSGVFVSWYSFLIYSLIIGPLFSFLSIDKYVWEFFSSFDTKYSLNNYRLFNAFDVILDGATWWLVLNEIFFLPFLNNKFNWKFTILIISVFILKFIFGRRKPIKNGPPEPFVIKDLSLKYNYDPEKKDLSKNNPNLWNYVWNRENKFNFQNILDGLFIWSYPSIHLIALYGLILFGQNNIGYVLLLIFGIIWKIISNRNWISDILSAVFLLLFFRQII